SMQKQPHRLVGLAQIVACSGQKSGFRLVAPLGRFLRLAQGCLGSLSIGYILYRAFVPYNSSPAVTHNACILRDPDPLPISADQLGDIRQRPKDDWGSAVCPAQEEYRLTGPNPRAVPSPHPGNELGLAAALEVCQQFRPKTLLLVKLGTDIRDFRDQRLG